MKTTLNDYLVLDNRIIEKTENLKLELGTAEKSTANPLFGEEYSSDPPKKWEARYDNLYPNVIYDDVEAVYKLWYNAFTIDPASEGTPLHERPSTNPQTHYTQEQTRYAQEREDGLLYAFSEDGIAWTKPELGLIPFKGSTDNNLVMDIHSHGIHGVGLFKDLEDPDPARRYKAFFRSLKDRRMAVAFSEDGLRWSTPALWPEHNAIGDTHNYALRKLDGSGYVGISRDWVGKPEADGLRVVVRTESSDFIHWSEPKIVLQGKDAHDQIYSMPVIRYGNLYLGLPAIFHKGDPKASDWDTVDTELAWSPDTIEWHRVCAGEALILRGEGSYPDGEYDCGCVYAAAPLLVGDTHYLYYGGSNGPHNGFREGTFNLATLPRGRFAGYSVAESSGRGSLTTRPFTLEEGGISVNVDVFEGGVLRAGLLNLEGGFLEGYSLDDCDPIRQGGLDIAMTWQNGLPKLAERELRLVVELNRATLYSVSGHLHFW